MPVHVALTPDVNSNSANQGEDAQTSLPVRDVVSIWRPKWSFGALGGKTGEQLADEAFAALLTKRHRPRTFVDALKQSARPIRE